MKHHFVWLALALTALWGHYVAWPALATQPAQASADGTQPFALVKDINTTSIPTGSVYASTLLGTINNHILFNASTPQTGMELWRTDGTSNGTQLVKDIWPGEQWGVGIGNQPSLMLNNQLLFTANDGAHGDELWATDGTTANTHLVKDLLPGADGSYLHDFVASGNRAFFMTQVTETQQALWITGGTPGGTTILHTFAKLQGTPMLVGSTLFFAAAETDDVELWKSDGTATGTMLVKDLVPGPDGSSPRLLFAFQGQEVWFSAHTSSKGYELWRSDGTAGGTRRFTQLSSGVVTTPPLLNTNAITMLPRSAQSTLPPRFVFDADDGTHSQELWVTDGTPTNTTLVKNVDPNGPSVQAALGMLPRASGYGLAFYALYDGTNGIQPWVTDGTSDGTVMLANIYPGSNSNPSQVTTIGKLAFFTATSPTTGRELWKTDGTTNGTALVADLNPGIKDSDPQDLTAFNGALYFTADDGVHGRELWRSDSNGITRVKDIAPGSNDGVSHMLGVAGGALYFAADDGTTNSELWKTDGTTKGTVLVQNIAQDIGGIFLYKGGNADVLDDTLLFGIDLSSSGEEIATSASYHATLLTRHNTVAARTTLGNTNTDDASTVALWQSDGTMAGTLPIKAFSNDPSGLPYDLTTLGDGMLFTASNTPDVTELWRTDGTSEGTRILTNTVTPSFGYVSDLTRLNNLVLFDVYTSTISTESANYSSLWRSDDTPQGTQMLAKDITIGYNARVVSGNTLFFAGKLKDQDSTGLWVSDGTPNGTHAIPMLAKENDVLSPQFLTPGRPGEVFFVADTGSNGYQLWKSDGTSKGTVLVKDVRPSDENDEYGEMAYVNGTLLFAANDGVNGWELWKSDGTNGGTSIVADIYPGSGSSQPEQLTGFNGMLYFSATGPDGMRTLWRSDGTSAGTQPVRNDAQAPLNPTELAVAQNQLLFSAADDAHGREVWRSDGSAAGTVLLQDIVPGAVSSNPEAFIEAGKQIYFTADTPDVGRELWAFTPAASNQPTPTLPPVQPTATLMPGQPTPTVPPDQPTPTVAPGQASTNRLYLPLVLR